MLTASHVTPLWQGVEAEVRLLASWPDCADTVQVGSVPCVLCVVCLQPVPVFCSSSTPACASGCALAPQQVAEVAGAPEALAAKAEKAAQLHFQGRSLAQALEAVARELA